MLNGKVAIVGAGPSGSYLAQALLKAAPGLAVDIIDSLPVPFGLVRYGVAADHQGTKAVTRQFARIFERQGARFFGNVHIGRDISLDSLRAAYDAVVLAAGLGADRRLTIPGSDLPGIHGAGALTRALHEHPEAEALPDLGTRPLILGNGNVAIDLLRILCKTAAELKGTDLGKGPSAWLAGNVFERITVVGRSPAASAKFDPAMIRELGKLENVSITVQDHGGSDDAQQQKRIEALASIDGHRAGPVRIIFRFELAPIAFEGGERVTGLRVQGPQGEETIEATSVLTAIGFTSSGELERDRLMEPSGREDAGKLADGLYSTGWFRRGPRGTIPDSRADAQQLAALILEEIQPVATRPGNDIFRRLADVVDYAGWQRIDMAELAAAPEDRCRRKFASSPDLLRAAVHRETKR